VDAKIIAIDHENKKVSLSIRAVLEGDLEFDSELEENTMAEADEESAAE